MLYLYWGDLISVARLENNPYTWSNFIEPWRQRKEVKEAKKNEGISFLENMGN